MEKAKTPILHNKNFKKNVFVICMLAYPLLQFAVFWIGTNFGAIGLTFKKMNFDTFTLEWCGFENFFEVFRKLGTDKFTQTMITNSLWYMPVTCFISLPLSVLFSYFLYKKMPLAGVYRVIFFLPSIIPVVVLTMTFTFVFDSSIGPVDLFLRRLGFKTPAWFASDPISQIMIFVYCIWAGLGYNIILLSGAISRLPQEIMEYSRLEGVGMARELFQIVVPLVWPTITTTFILGCTSVFTVMLQPLMLTNSRPENNTIALYVYNIAKGDDTGYATAFGLILSLFGVPLIMFIRWALGKIYADVEF